MKAPKFDPGLALFFGLLIAPAACALNSLVLRLFFGGVYQRLLPDVLNVWFSSLILTFPLGWMTARLIEIWQKGRFAAARTLGLGCGLFAVALWYFLWTASPYSLDFGALAIPFLWSIWFLVFAIFARPPKN